MGKRRVRIAADAEGDDLPFTSHPLPLRQGLAVLGVLLVLVLLAGIGMTYAASPPAPKVAALAGCKTAPAIAPRHFVARPPMCIDTRRTYLVSLTTTQGTFGITVQPKASPVAANNFIVLALSGYYTGTSFFRADTTFVQGGDPLGNGRGGPGYTLPSESNAPGFRAYSVGMARTPGGAVNGSQFFILKLDWPSSGPNGIYDRFGVVTSGNSVVTALTTADRILSAEVR